MTSDASSNKPPAGETDLSGLHTVMPDRPGGLRRLQPGETFAARYAIEALIGEGGAGSVYRAHDRRSGRHVALKLIRADRLDTPAARTRLVSEAVTARDIRHPNVVAVYDVDEADGQPFMTMELLQGRSLRAWMRERMHGDADVPMATAAAMVREILSGLEAAHARGVIHRDLKPENVFLTAEPEGADVSLRLLDFGIAHAAGARSDGAALGTATYAAPEQITAPDAVRFAADLYALSVIFYELLAGVPPHGRYTPPGRGRDDVPAGIDDLIDKGLTNNPRGRPQSAKDYRAALEAALGGELPAVKAAVLQQAASTPAARAYAGIRETRAPDDLRHFIEAFPGTEEAFEARRRIPALEAELARETEARKAREEQARQDAEAQAARAAEDQRRRTPGAEFRDGGGLPLMVTVPPGRFLMGSPETEKGRYAREGPQREVRIARPFAAGKFPVTVGEWRRFVEATGHDAGERWAAPGFPQDDNHPVTCVNWDDANAYAAWVSRLTSHTYRLLSEAEWEYACRAGTTSAYSFGAAISTAQANRNNILGGTTPVGQYPANAFGLCDMHGNVLEWVEDCYEDSYSAGQPSDGSAFTKDSCSVRVARGGSWYSVPASLRSAYRLRGSPSSRSYILGFRVARAAPGQN